MNPCGFLDLLGCLLCLIWDCDHSTVFCGQEGVVFVLSGFVNPERSTLRSQALEMGAEYQPDWNSDCTLLVCAFPNTPKFRQVEADCGTIVSKVSPSFSCLHVVMWIICLCIDSSWVFISFFEICMQFSVFAILNLRWWLDVNRDQMVFFSSWSKFGDALPW